MTYYIKNEHIMSDDINNGKPQVFKIDEQEQKNYQLSPNENEINVYPATEGELANALIMKHEAEELIRIRQEGEALGLYGKKLKEYVVEHSGDLVKRPHLSIAKPTANVVYNTDEVIEEDITKDKVKMEKYKEEYLSHFNDEEDEEDDNEEWLAKVSEKQVDAPYELVKIPSLGKQYKHKDGEFIKMAFMNGSDENILTNSNILKSGRFLEILFSRKILSNIKYKDLIPADRDALMIWLRGTAYGDKYPIQVADPKQKTEADEPVIYDVDIELSNLPIKYLKLTPNKKRNFEFKTELGNVIEFRYLTVGQLESFQKYVLGEFEKYGDKYVDTMTDFLAELIVSYNGETDKEKIRKHVKYMRSIELKAFRTFMAENDFGVDFALKIETIGGVVETNFPINAEFFWAS